MEKVIKKSISGGLGFEFEYLTETTTKFGQVIKKIKSRIGDTEYDLIEQLGNYYIKKTTDDWVFGDGFREQIIVSDLGQFVNYKIEKNGSTTINNLANFREDYMIPTRENKNQYRQFIIEKNKNAYKMYNKVDELEEFHNDYKHFFVYRDPINRFLSIVNFCNSVQSIGAPLNQKFKNKRDIIDNYILLCSLTELNSSVSSGERHFLSQSKHIKDSYKVDFMVEIDDLTYFLESRLKNKLGDRVLKNDFHRNETNIQTQHITIGDLTEQDINLIKTIYADDYLLYKKYENVKYCITD